MVSKLTLILPSHSASNSGIILPKAVAIVPLGTLKFISIVSHELRTPLTAIKNAMDIVLSGKAGDMTENI